MTLPELPERFSRLQFPVHKIEAESPADLFKVIPGIRRYFQKVDKENPKTSSRYRGPKGLVCVIRYIVMLYDPESDLIEEFMDDPRLRKEAAAREAGFKRDRDGEWPQEVMDLMDFKDEEAVDWILDYLKVKKNHIWREIVFLEEELDQIYRIRSSDFERANKLKLDEESKKKIEQLKLYKKQFYSEHHDLRKVTEEQLIPVSPENVFIQLNVPEELYKVRQVQDVSQITKIPETSN